MIYSEASRFDGYAFAHIAAWQERKWEAERDARNRAAARAADRRRGGRGRAC